LTSRDPRGPPLVAVSQPFRVRSMKDARREHFDAVAHSGVESLDFMTNDVLGAEQQVPW